MSEIPSLEQLTAMQIAKQALLQLNGQELYDILGRSKVCELFGYCITTSEGKAMILQCMKRPRCSELWSNLGELDDLTIYWTRRRTQVLTRDHNICFKICDNQIIYYLEGNANSGKIVSSWSELPRMYADFRRRGVTEEEISCIMGPIAVHMQHMFPDSTPNP